MALPKLEQAGDRVARRLLRAAGSSTGPQPLPPGALTGNGPRMRYAPFPPGTRIIELRRNLSIPDNDGHSFDALAPHAP